MLSQNPTQTQILLAPYAYDERLHRGVLRYAAQNNWQVQLIDATSWKNYTTLKPDGIISLMAPHSDQTSPILPQTPKIGGVPEDEDEGMSQHVASLRAPHIDLGYFRPEVPAIRVVPDNSAAGRLAARHLIEQGGRNFLHLADSPTQQDLERYEGYQTALQQAGYQASVIYASHDKIKDDVAMLDALMKLPRPLSVFCSFDVWAALVLSACRLGNLRIPEDVAILGCYNHELISAFENPTLSSIDMNIEGRGYFAAETLHQLMKGETFSEKILRTPINGLIARASTQLRAEIPPTLASAMLFINKHLNQALDVPSLAIAVGVSRSVLQNQCRQHFGHGIGEAITKARLAKACELLRNSSQTASDIAYALGYPTPFQFYRVFKKNIGMTAVEYRRSLST